MRMATEGAKIVLVVNFLEELKREKEKGKGRKDVPFINLSVPFGSKSHRFESFRKLQECQK